MYVQTTPACRKECKKRICFLIATDYPKGELNLKTKNGVLETDNAFVNVSKSLIKDKTYEIVCRKKKIGCKDCYFVCCHELVTSKRISTPTPPFNKGNHS